MTVCQASWKCDNKVNRILVPAELTALWERLSVPWNGRSPNLDLQGGVKEGFNDQRTLLSTCVWMVPERLLKVDNI